MSVEAPERIWAKTDSATVYMDGSSPVVGSTRQKHSLVEYVRADIDGQSEPDAWLVIGPTEDKRVVLDAAKYNPTDPAFWVYGEIPDDASVYPLFASKNAATLNFRDAREKIYTAIRVFTAATVDEAEEATNTIMLIMQDASSGDLLVAEMPDEDDIEEAISGSIDIDWTPRDAAREVMRLLQKGVNRTGRNGELLERSCPNDPNTDPRNENIYGDVLNALTDLERYLRDTPHHNSTQAAAARAVIARAEGRQP